MSLDYGPFVLRDLVEYETFRVKIIFITRDPRAIATRGGHVLFGSIANKHIIHSAKVPNIWGSSIFFNRRNMPTPDRYIGVCIFWWNGKVSADVRPLQY